MPVGREPHVRLPFAPHLVRLAARYDESVRDGEIAALVARLEKEERPFVVAGDFNLCDRSAGYRVLEAVAEDSFHAAGDGFGTTWPVGQVRGLPEWMPPALRIDYVWHAASFETRAARVGPPLGSDHRPVVVDLSPKWPTGGGAAGSSSPRRIPAAHVVPLAAALHVGH
jgi:endonuclease/exonuclease/phosphatase family metal-dependent hydrolase